MELFKMAKEAMSMRSKLKEMEKVLKAKVVDVEYKGVKIKINAKSEILDLKLPEDVLSKSVKDVEKLVLSAFQEAISRSQKEMAEESKKMMGGLNIPGLN
ncbi:YbaB/EbfC family nucleoid-associated protein [Candidatus Ruminimicrobium bovinum]|uniref:YbaB/EbfC family nucleoid-associated protein n=1 Tax=Candidatus Ruminimicrobium bovinum TaxID=3242779 RepID=UPI0039B944C2